MKKFWIKEIIKTFKIADYLKEQGEIQHAKRFYQKGYDMIQHLKLLAIKNKEKI